MGAKKEKGSPVKCKCPRCKKEYEMNLFVFNHKKDKIYHKYCAACKGLVENVNGNYVTGSSGHWIKEGKSNNA